jgi:hypothetical protein
MSGLPPDGEWLIQQIGNEVILFHRHTEEEIVRFRPGELSSVLPAQQVIAEDRRLDVEQKSFAHFWSGYFFAHAHGVEVTGPAPGDALRRLDST